MFTKIGTEGVLGLFGDNTWTLIRWEEHCVKANQINISKLIFILLDSLACPKIYVTIYITIYCMLHACCTHAARCTKTCIAFVGPWRIKGGGDDLFISPNRFHLSCPSTYKVPFSLITTMSSLNFLPRGLCRQSDESSCGANRRTRYDCWDWWV